MEQKQLPRNRSILGNRTLRKLQFAVSLLLLQGLAVPCFAEESNIVSTQTAIAQARPDSTIIPTDQLPTPIGQERQLFSSPIKLMLLERLPARMYFNAVTEASQRFESNVFNNARSPRRDYVFRILPNVTLGYNVLKRTNVYANYFMIKDVFARTPALNQSTFHSIAGGIQQDVPIGRKTNLQLNMQVRQLFQAQNFYQADMLPGITVTHFFSPNRIAFFNSQLQLRSRNLFMGTPREIDPFYTVGMVNRRGAWTFTSTGTLVNNFRNHRAVPPIKNSSIICDFELSRPVPRLLGVDMFVRAEPIWNWGAGRAPGLSGFDFRLFGGMRIAISKPAINSQMEFLRKQLQESERTHGR